MTDEPNRRSHRRLPRELIETDLHLQAWGRWARGEIARHAWPKESPMFRAIREARLGIRARSTSTGLEASAEVVACDKIVARLPERQRRAVWAHYIGGGETRLHCARQAQQTEREFSANLERARWIVWSALPVYAHEAGKPIAQGC